MPKETEKFKTRAKNALIPYIKTLYPSATDDAVENVADYILYMIEDDGYYQLFYDAEAWAAGEFDDE